MVGGMASIDLAFDVNMCFLDDLTRFNKIAT